MVQRLGQEVAGDFMTVGEWAEGIYRMISVAELLSIWRYSRNHRGEFWPSLVDQSRCLVLSQRETDHIRLSIEDTP